MCVGTEHLVQLRVGNRAPWSGVLWLGLWGAWAEAPPRLYQPLAHTSYPVNLEKVIFFLLVLYSCFCVFA